MTDEMDDVEILERDETIEEEDLAEEESQEDIKDEIGYQENIASEATERMVKALKKATPKKIIKKTVKVKVQPKKVKKKVSKKAVKKITKKIVKKPTPAKSAMKVYIKKVKVSHKKEKKEKHGKRGPKGPQSSSWSMPYQPSSTLHKAFVLCTKKGGIKLKELIKAIKKFGGTPAWVITQLKLGHSLGWVWEVDDSNERLRVLNWRNMTKKLKRKQ